MEGEGAIVPPGARNIRLVTPVYIIEAATSALNDEATGRFRTLPAPASAHMN
jgi:hypothetical protein